MWRLSCLAPQDLFQWAVLSFVAAQIIVLRRNLSANGVILDSRLTAEARWPLSLRSQCQPHIMNFKKERAASLL